MLIQFVLVIWFFDWLINLGEKWYSIYQILNRNKQFYCLAVPAPPKYHLRLFYCHFLIWGHKGNIAGSTVLPLWHRGQIHIVMSMIHADLFNIMPFLWNPFTKSHFFEGMSVRYRKVIKERSLIKVISTICCLIDEQCVNN